MKLVLTAAALTLLLVGCATPRQAPVNMGAEALGSKSGRIGVVMTPLPKVDTYLDGAGCLLCIAAASVANSSLTSHAATLSASDLLVLKEDIAKRIRQKGGNAIVIKEDLDLETLPRANAKGPGLAREDFTSLQQTYQVDKLIVVQITRVGFLRNYANYFPTSDPKAHVSASGYMVDLRTNGYEWLLPVSVSRSADGSWDESPAFPGLTNAYYQAVESAKDQLLQPFGK